MIDVYRCDDDYFLSLSYLSPVLYSTMLWILFVTLAKVHLFLIIFFDIHIYIYIYIYKNATVISSDR